MSRIAYVNGRYVPQHLATVNIEDRGYQFADGVNEVIGVYGGKLVDAERHFDRLERSLAELRIAAPCRRGVLGLIARRLVSRNDITDGMVYLQVSRGEAPRNHAFPRDARPSMVVTARRGQPASSPALVEGVVGERGRLDVMVCSAGGSAASPTYIPHGSADEFIRTYPANEVFNQRIAFPAPPAPPDSDPESGKDEAGL